MKSSGLLASIALAIQELTDGLDLYVVRAQAAACRGAWYNEEMTLNRREHVLSSQLSTLNERATSACDRSARILLCNAGCSAAVMMSVTCSDERGVL